MLVITPEEEKIIQEIRKRGQASLSDLVKELKIHRSTLYYQVQSLLGKGVVREVKVSARRSLYQVAGADQLQRVISAQQEALAKLLLDSPRTTVAGHKPKVVFCDWYVLPQEMLELLGGYEVVTYPDSPVRISPEAFGLRCAEADVVVTFFSVNITKEMLVQCPRLKCIVTASITREMIDEVACRELGIEVVSLRTHDYYKQAARREFVFASLFNVLRPVYPAAGALRLGQFDYRGFSAEELSGKTVGVVGVKREGREIIPLLRAFGCGVEVCDPDRTAVPPSDVGVANFVSLEDLFQTCDVVVFPEDLNDEIDLGSKLLKKTMKPQYFLFLSYSLKLDLDVIRELIISRHIKAIALDYFSDVMGVFQDFPRSQYRKIMNFPGVVVTPELGFYTRQSMERNNREVLEILQNLKLTGSVA